MPPETAQKVADITMIGIVVDVQTFFDAAKDQKEQSKGAADICSSRALVTDRGVYAFLESTGNADRLGPAAIGSTVKVTGKLLIAGALLQLETLEPVTNPPAIDLAKFSKAPGKPVTIAGRNLCQCGLQLNGLPHSCKLGHLHHLQANDGKIYHYLQFQSGKDMFLGKGSHFRNVQVTATELPGQYLLVKTANVDSK